jgi:valyl-tRNA synthetase
MARKQKEIADREKFIAAKRKKLENQSFVAKAPADVVQKERDSLADLEAQQAAARRVLEQLAALGG